MRRGLMICLSLLIGLMACSNLQKRENSNPDNHPTVIPLTMTPNSTKTQTPEISGTSKVNSLPTEASTAEVVEIEETDEIKCLSPLPNPHPANFGFDGVIVYYDQEQDGYYLVGQKPLKYIKLPIERTQSSQIGQFSPDGKRLSFAPDDRRLWLLTGTSGMKEAQFDQMKARSNLPDGSTYLGWNFYEWVNNHLIRTSIAYKDENQERYYKDLYINPDDGSSVIKPLPDLPKQSVSSKTALAPDLTRVVYISDDYSYLITLFDLEEEKVLFQTPYSDYNVIDGAGLVNDNVVWSHDSTRVAFTGAEVDTSDKRPADQTGVYILDREGSNNLRVTHFDQMYDSFQVNALQWSPDDRLLAMSVFLSKNNATSTNLYIYDTYKNTFVLTCPLVGDVLDRLAWSPDSKYIVYSAGSYESISGPLLILDINSKVVYELAKKVSHIGGWSSTFLEEN